MNITNEKITATITVAQAARALGRATRTIEKGIRSGALPFGTAYKTEAGRYVYIVPRKAFERYLDGDLRGGTNER